MVSVCRSITQTPLNSKTAAECPQCKIRNCTGKPTCSQFTFNPQVNNPTVAKSINLGGVERNRNQNEESIKIKREKVSFFDSALYWSSSRDQPNNKYYDANDQQDMYQEADSG